jgi:DNA-binding CsgD family transcriptional regulator
MRRKFRELELIELLAEGKSTKQICDAMGYAEQTIDSYRSRLFRKYNANNATHLVSIFYQTGKLKLSKYE